MVRLWCPKCHEYANNNQVQNPATNKLHCGHCKTVLLDWDQIDEEIKRYEVVGC